MVQGTVRAGIGLVVMLLLSSAPGVHAQEWSWPERGENLTELPSTFTGQRIRAVMTGFTSALGVRCSHCHVGEEGAPLSTYDFVSDENPNKNTARAMLRLLGAVNDHLAEIEPTGEEVNMWCHTCHNGKPRPQILSETLMERYRAAGADATIDLYVALREQYFGGRSYDFRPRNINGIAAGLFEEGETGAARRLSELNVEQWPESALAHEGLGDVLSEEGDRAGAIERYERALELAPDNRGLQRKLEAIRGG